MTLRAHLAPAAADNSSDKPKGELAPQKPNTPLNRLFRAPSSLPEPRRRLKKVKVAKPDMAQAALETGSPPPFGSRNADFLDGILSQLISAGELGRKTDDREIKFSALRD